MSEPLVDVTGRRRARAHQVRRRRLKWGAIIAAVLAVVAGLSWVIWGSPWLMVTNVEVRGSALASTQQVIDAASVPMGTPLASLDTGAIERRITEALPSVATATASRSWPGTVVIDITERRASAAIPLGHQFLWVAADGVVFHRTQAPPEGVLVAEGSITDEGTIASLAQVAAALPPQVRERAKAISAGSRDSITIPLTDGRRVVWGSADDSALKAQVVVPLLNVKAREYDVSAPTHPTTR